MPTREEEFKNLNEMYDTLSRINSLTDKKSKLTKKIEKWKERKIDGYPKYVPANHAEKALKDLKNDKEGTKFMIHIATLIPIVIYGIVCFFMRATSGNEGFFDMIIFTAIFFAPLILALVPAFGHYLAAVAHVLIGLFLSLGGSEDAIMYRNLFLTSAAILVASNILYWIINPIAMACLKKKEKSILHKAELADKKDYQDYLDAKAVAEVEIARKTEELEKEKSEAILSLRKEIAVISAEIIEKVKIFKNIPGLAYEDKNEYTLKTLISYFQRGRADSIKEALNLFIAEENQKKRNEEINKKIRGGIASLQFQHDLAISDMKNAQALHNINVQHRIDSISNKINDAIEDMKRDSDY